jgi:hypothetical protein
MIAPYAVYFFFNEMLKVADVDGAARQDIVRRLSEQPDTNQHQKRKQQTGTAGHHGNNNEK